MASTDLPNYLTPPYTIHVLISVLAGSQNAQSYHNETLSPFLHSHGVAHTTHETKSSSTITELTRSVFLPAALRREKQTLILLSGDGGVVDVVNALTTPYPALGSGAETSTTNYVSPVLVLIPMGTANALAHSAGIVKADPLKILRSGAPKPLPLIEVTFSAGARAVVDEGRGREDLPSSTSTSPVTSTATTAPSDTERNGGSILHGAVVFSWGLHASLVAMSDTAEMRKHGIARFKMAAQTLVEEGHQYKGAVKVLKRKKTEAGTEKEDWQPLSYAAASTTVGDTHSYILATLVSNLEEHFTISPASQPLDGSLRLVAIPGSDSADIIRILGLAYQGGKHVDDELVRYEEIAGLRIEMHEAEEKWRFVCLDGTIVAVAEGGWVEVRRRDGQGAVVELVC